jgi:hypothetical protein
VVYDTLEFGVLVYYVVGQEVGREEGLAVCGRYVIGVKYLA